MIGVLALACVGAFGVLALADPEPSNTVESDPSAPSGCGADLADLALPPARPVEARVALTGGFGIEFVDPDGANREGVYRPPTALAEWSADGTRAVVSSGGITVIDFDGPAASSRSLGLDGASAPSLDPTGELVAFARDGHAWVRAVDGGSETDLGPVDLPIANEPAAAWSADGEYLAVDRGTDVYVVDLEGEQRVLLPRLEDSRANFPVWSPTDDRLAYVDGDGLSVVDSDGDNRHLIVRSSDAGYPLRAAWSPDGRFLSLLWNDRSPEGVPRTQVCVAPVGGGQPQRVDVVLGMTVAPPLWSPAGDAILSVRTMIGTDLEPGVVVVQVPSGDAVPISPISPEGRWVPTVPVED